MSKIIVAINTGGDNAVLSGGANLLRNLHAAGLTGVFFNLVTLTSCAYVRAQSEIRKSHPQKVGPLTRREAVLSDLRTSLAVSGLMQLSVAATIAVRGGGLNEHTLKEMAVPILFGTGSLISAKSVLRTLFRGVADATTVTVRNMQSPTRKVAAYIFGQPDLYWAAGLMAASGSRVATGIFATGLTLQLAQGFWKMRATSDVPKGAVARFMDMKNVPMVVQAGGCAVSAILHWHAGRPLDAGAMGIFTLGFLGYAIENKWHGVVEAYHALRPAVKKLASATSAVIA